MLVSGFLENDEVRPDHHDGSCECCLSQEPLEFGVHFRSSARDVDGLHIPLAHDLEHRLEGIVTKRLGAGRT